jgi:RNA-binding protein YlmH
MDRSNIDKIAKTQDEKMLLAKVWDKINSGMRKNIPSTSCFLTPREQEMVQYLFGAAEGLVSFGGYADAERKMLIYLPDYLDETYLYSEDSPIICLRASYYQDATPLSHRDFLGALMGAGIAREVIGDICVGKEWCDFFVTREMAPYVLQNLSEAGRTKLRIETIPLGVVVVEAPATKEIKDTLASLRLDSLISSGFRIGRSQAVQYITAGKVSVDGLLCEKPDKTVLEGMKVSVRGQGKIKLRAVNGTTKKGRISVVIDRYV